MFLTSPCPRQKARETHCSVARDNPSGKGQDYVEHGRVNPHAVFHEPFKGRFNNNFGRRKRKDGVGPFMTGSLKETGVDKARADSTNLHPMLFEFFVHRFGEAYDEGLGGCIESETGQRPATR